MKKTSLLLMLGLFFYTSCSNDDSGDATLPATPKYETYISAETDAILKSLKFTINEGDNPPSVEGVYWGEFMQVTESNILGDFMITGSDIGDMTYNLYDQKANKTISSKLTMQYDMSLYKNKEEYSGTGTLISGAGDKFTIYSIYDGNLYLANGDVAKGKLLYLISAQLVKDENGNNAALKNTQSVLLMLDDYGDPLVTLIDVGKARKYISMQDAKIKK